MKRTHALFICTLSLFASLSSNVALAGGFPGIDLPDTSIRSFTNTVEWNDRVTSKYLFTTIGFKAELKDKIKRSMDKMYNVLRDPENLSNNGPTTDFQQCILANATKNQNPNWLSADLDERRYAVAIISGMMVTSAGKLNMIHAFTETKPSGKRDFVRAGFAKVGKVEGNMNTIIHINTALVEKRSEERVAGVIMHEIMHNLGWTHPSTGKGKTDYPGTFIKEAQNCLVKQLTTGPIPKGLHDDDGIIFEAE